MLRVALAGLRTHALRTVLTALAVVLGGGMLGGSIIYGDTTRAAFFNDLARSTRGVDVAADAYPGHRPVTPATLAALAKLPGVAHVDGRVTARLGLLGTNGRVLTNAGQTGFAVNIPNWSGFARADTVAGRLPSAAGETALDQPTAEREHIGLGDQVRVIGPRGVPVPLTVVGVLDYGVSPDFSDFSVASLTDGDLVALVGPHDVDQVVVAAAPGASVDGLASAVSATLGPGFGVQTGADLRHQVAVTSAKYVDGFLDILLASSLVALAVAGLVVYNTFQILIAQRQREFALLRCVGASRAQLVQLVMIESTVVGGVASLGGAVLSIAAGEALLLGRAAFGRALPDNSLTVSPLAVLVPLVLGLVVTFASALLPAIAARRVSPLAALQTSTDLTPQPGGRVRAALVFVAAGALTTVGALVLNSGRHRGFDGLVPMVGGAMIIFVAVVLVLPFTVTVLAAPLRWLLGGAFGTVGRLAMDNARRHPVRFAASAAALMLGIAPLTTFAVLLTTAKVQAARELAENFPIDFTVTHADAAGGRTPVPDAVVAKLRAAPALGSVVLCRVATTSSDIATTRVTTVEPGALGTQVSPETVDGSLDGLAPGTAALQVRYARANGIDLGDRLRLADAFTVLVVALYDDSAIPGDVLANWTDFTAHLRGDDYLLVRRAEGIDAATAADAVDAAVADDPAAVVASVAERRDSLADSLDNRLVHFDVLLGASMAIALLGIANTLALSVLDRRRESATLRALGLTRRQLSNMLLVEAALMAIVGAVIGVVFGIGVGWIAAHELIATYGHGAPDIPLTNIGGYVGLAAAAGALASVLPARRAMRASVVESMGD
jgi:putative ABC transport system permease protein